MITRERTRQNDVVVLLEDIFKNIETRMVGDNFSLRQGGQRCVEKLYRKAQSRLK